VGAIVLLAAALAAFFSREIVGYDPDEIGYTHLAIGIAHSLTPITLSHGGSQRPNQLYPLLISPIWGLFGNVAAFRITHIWNTLLMASAAIPSYLLAREVMDRRWAAYLVAVLVAFAPWATLSLTELTEIAAYPACAWALLAMQRSLADPSPRRDLLAVAAIALACFGRLQLVLLAPVLVAAMLLHELGYGLTGPADRRSGLREALRRILRRHAVLSALGLVGVVIGVPLLLSGTLASVFGFYGDTLAGATLNGATFDLARSYFVFIALGLGALPAALAIGFFCESLLAPASRRAHAFASLAVLTVVALTLQVAEVSVRFNEGVLQERYLFYIVPLLAVGMCAALLLTRHPLSMVLGGSAVLAVLVGTAHYESARSAFWYQASPAMTGFYDWIVPAVGAAGGPGANPGGSRLLLAGVVVFAAGLLLALIARRLAPARLLAGVAAVAIIFTGAETVHALWHVVHGSSSGKGYGNGSLSGVDWVDHSVPSGAAVAQVVSNVGGLSESRGLWEDSEFWNRSIVGSYTFGDISDAYFGSPKLRVDNSSGAVALDHGGSAGAGGPAQPYLVVAARGFPVAFAGTVLGHSPAGTLDVLRSAVPSRAAWAISGVSSNGWLAVERPATLRLFMLRGAAGRCVNVGVTAWLSSISASPRSLVVSGPGVRSEVQFEPGRTRTVYTRVCSEAAAVPQLSLSSRQGLLASDPQLTLQLQRVTVAAA
jgi:hypothetical protein